MTLNCSVAVDPDYCPPKLRWYLNNISEPLKSSEKYKIEERKTHSKCKNDFILTIVNLTESDKGTYGCHSFSSVWGNTSAAFELKVFHEPPGKSVLSMSLQTFKQLHLGLKLVGCLDDTELLADWLTGRQTDRQTDRQADRRMSGWSK